MPLPLPEDILVLIFDHLSADLDYTTLCNAGSASREWRSLALPCLLRRVDVSSHNNGRQPQFEDPDFYPYIDASYSWDYRQPNLVQRQRAFIRLTTEQPSLARHVQSFTWTLVWANLCSGIPCLDEDDVDYEEGILESDKQTWNVFSRLTNVKVLDLASLFDSLWKEPYVRQNPSTLFPAVTDLRMLGWTHRGLVKAIFGSIDVSKLHSLRLDYLNDEGALPDGRPMPEVINRKYIRHSRPNRSRLLSRSGETIGADLIARQDAGAAFVFPGPMWYPLHLLNVCSTPLQSLRHLQVKISPVARSIDPRGYHTIFRATADLLLKASSTLRTVVIVLGEHQSTYVPPKWGGCQFGRGEFEQYTQPWIIRAAAIFLEHIITSLNEGSFPHLKKLTLEGFGSIAMAWEKDKLEPPLDTIWATIESCRFYNGKDNFTRVKSIDRRRIWNGHHGIGPDWSANEDLLLTS